jgi:hypothetical protein
MIVKKASAYFLGLFLFLGCTSIKPQQATEKWISLFNGKDIKNWMIKIQHYDINQDPDNTFRVENGILKVRYDKYGAFNDRFGHVYYKTPFSSYHLKLEYRFVGEIQTGAPSYTLRNSGVMFHSQDPRTMPKEQDWPISIEFQFLGGLGDGKERSTGNMCSPGTNIFYNGVLDERHCINSTSKTYDGEQWVRAELIVLGDSLITHIINGDTVMRYSKPQIGGGVANRFDPKIKQDGKLLKSGFIALQSEGHPVDFRNVKLMDLSNKK